MADPCSVYFPGLKMPRKSFQVIAPAAAIGSMTPETLVTKLSAIRF